MRMETDVLVVGGGTAGVTAALSAARRGVRVMVAERDGALGGVATRAGIHIYYHGVSAGLQKEIDARTRRLGKALGGRPPGFHPEARRLVAFEMLREAGVQVIFHAIASDVKVEGRRVRGVQFETPDGTVYIASQVTVDATGDGDVCVLAGAEFTFGRDWDGVANNYSLVPRFIQDGHIALWNFDGGWVDSTSAQDISRACMEGRRHLHERMGEHLTPEILISVAPQVGIREGRLIVGEYRLTLHDQAVGRTFPDAVMRCQAHFDTHARDFANENLTAQIWSCLLGRWSDPIGCDVPYRCFIPRGIDGLLIGCRALSQTRDSSQALRMQRDVQQVGEVAGTAAALSVQSGREPRHVDIQQLQAWLREQGVLAECEEGLDVGVVGAGAVTRRHVTAEDLDDVVVIDADTRRSVNPSPQPQDWIRLLGTDDEGKAIWKLWQAGEHSVAPLLMALPSASHEQAIGIAITLALMGRTEGVPYLADSVRRGDSEQWRRSGSVPRWIRCLIALRLLGDASVALDVAARLQGLTESATALFVLHYLIAVGSDLPETERHGMADAVEAFLRRPNLGEDYILWGGVQTSMRWSLELTAGALLSQLGRTGAAQRIVERYRTDERIFVRRAAERMASRL